MVREKLMGDPSEGLAKIEESRHEEQILKEHKSDMLINKDFKYTVRITKQRMVNLPPGHHVTNCLICYHTCHQNCPYGNDDDKWRCTAMDGGNIHTGRCTVSW